MRDGRKEVRRRVMEEWREGDGGAFIKIHGQLTSMSTVGSLLFLQVKMDLVAIFGLWVRQRR